MSDENDLDEDFIEKRSRTRKSVNADVRVEVDGKVIHGEAHDISLSGVAINSLVDLTTEQFVRLHLEKIGELTGEVVRELEDGFAVEFDTIKDNGSVLEDKLRTMMGNSEKEQASDDPDEEIARERAAMEAQLMAMMGGAIEEDK